MKYGSVCSGIEAASVAWAPLGWDASFVSEIEAFPSAVLAHRFPNVPNAGDFTKIQKGEYDDINLLVGGTPCQDFSVAGKRAGFEGLRGGLTFAYVDLVRRLMPRWIVWENVPGVLSGDCRRGFFRFLQALADIGYCCTYRILDAKYVRVDGLEFAVPQRRRRVFVVGYLGDWRPPAAVLFEPESLRGDSPPCRKAWQGFASDVAGCVTSSRAERIGDPTGQDNVVVGTLDGSGVARTLSARHDGSPCADRGPDVVCMETSATNAEIVKNASPTLTCSHDGAPIAFSCKDNGRDCNENVSPTLRAMGGESPNGGGQVAVAFNGDQSEKTHSMGESVEHTPTLRSGGPTHVAYGIPGNWIGRKPENGGHATKPMSNLAPNLTKTDRHAVAFQQNQLGEIRTGAVAGTLNTNSTASGRNTPLMQSEMTVRRLTPLECERLQGFPDHWTAIERQRRRIKGADADYLRHVGLPVESAADGKLYTTIADDGVRYKALGNSMAVNCMRWIGRRIQMVEEILEGQT